MTKFSIFSDHTRCPAPPRTIHSGKILTPHFPKYLSICTYITVKFQLRSSINVRLTENSVYNRLCIERSPKMVFWVILGIGAKIFGGKVHPSSELRVFRHLWSKSDASCSSILHGYTHLPQVKIWASLGSQLPYQKSQETPRPESTPLDL